MAITYEEAVAALYRAPHDGFVTERKRLAVELRTSGDKTGAARLAKLPRPPISAWTVNQLWWRERALIEALFSVAARVRAGDLSATGEHRDLMAKLRPRAAFLLAQGGHAASEATLRRVTTTLSALAAEGSFQPDLPGALSGDREPPGFEAMAVFATSQEVGSAATVHGAGARTEPALIETARRAADRRADDRRAEEQRRLEQQRHAEEQRRLEQQRHAEEQRRIEEERLRAEAERARIAAERRRLELELVAARGELEARAQDAARLRAELAGVEAAFERARALVAQLEARLAALVGAR